MRISDTLAQEYPRSTRPVLDVRRGPGFGWRPARHRDPAPLLDLVAVEPEGRRGLVPGAGAAAASRTVRQAEGADRVYADPAGREQLGPAWQRGIEEPDVAAGQKRDRRRAVRGPRRHPEEPGGGRKSGGSGKRGDFGGRRFI